MTDEELLDHLIALQESYKYTKFGRAVLDAAINVLVAKAS